ncbi:lactose regulatory protein LAC9 [Plectosphaerella cucumerina]|uniref:Lactose regulatory protein LAC9 n=1 Tax=Plectosphaerella cucumerina TaxID=40658 RepID=A0A8K0TIS7_9PEZI|nr:lactose regulatory protein LAC9 [Plectosphaerella cucumerina]
MSEPNSQSALACDYCRVKKLKCSKEKPRCSACAQLDASCHYSGRPRRSPLTRAYLSSVEKRLAKVEALFAQLLPHVNLEEALAGGPGDARKTTAPEVPRTETSPRSPVAPATPGTGGPISEAVPDEADGFDWQEDVDVLADGMAALSVEPRGTGYLGSTAGVFFLRSLFLLTGQPKPMAESRPILPQPLPTIDLASSRLSDVVASREVVGRLVDSYFSTYHRIYPFVHEPTFRAQLHEVIPRPQRRSWQMLLHTILALGAWCLDDPQGELDDDLYHHALSFGEDESLFESANLTFVQALVLLSNLSQKRNKPNTGSNFLGLATRMALSLGLHRELPDWRINMLQRETRRRVWWGLYIFDSGASTTFGRPILLPDTEAMDVRPVLNIHDESLTSRTTTLPGEINQPTLYSGLKVQSDLHIHSNYISNRLLSSSSVSPEAALAMDTTLNAWADTLPSYFRRDYDGSFDEPTFNFTKSRLWWRFWNLKIILLRQLLLQRAIDKGKGTVPVEVDPIDEQCRQIAIAAASATIESIDSYTKHGVITRLVSWYSIFFVFHASLVIVLAIIGDVDSPEMANWQRDLDTVRHVFRDVFSNNPLASRCASILDEIMLPGYLDSAENWASFDTEAWPMNFQDWPSDVNDDFFNILGYPTGNMGM